MSAYIVKAETINKIVSYLYAKAAGGATSIVSLGLVRMGYDLSDLLYIERLADAMFNLNVEAIRTRYGDVETFHSTVFKYLFIPAAQIEIIKALECWMYQCTEGDIPGSELYKAMAATYFLLCKDYIHQLDEYEVAPWG
jgi:hypothetical protein